MSWSNYIKSVTIALPFPVAIGVECTNGNETIFIELSVRCHETGAAITVKTRQVVQPLAMLTDREAAEAIRGLLRVALAHEIDEAITVDGERPFNPHRTRAAP